MGPFLSRNHYAAFIEAVLPIALYRAVRRERESLLYSGMAAAMYASVIASASRAGTVLATAEVVLVPLSAVGSSPRLRPQRRHCRTAHVHPLRGLYCRGGMGLCVDSFSRARPASHTTGTRRVHTPHGHRTPLVWIGSWHLAHRLSPIRHHRYRGVRQPGPQRLAAMDRRGRLPLRHSARHPVLLVPRPAFRSVWGMGVVAVFLHAIVDYPFSRPALGSWTILILAMLAVRNLPSTVESHEPPA